MRRMRQKKHEKDNRIGKFRWKLMEKTRDKRSQEGKKG